jgi:hypothetical protein
VTKADQFPKMNCGEHIVGDVPRAEANRLEAETSMVRA